MRLQDINIDGFPDIFITLDFKNPNAKGQPIRESYILLSQACSKGACNDDAVRADDEELEPRRYFSIKNTDEKID